MAGGRRNKGKVAAATGGGAKRTANKIVDVGLLRTKADTATLSLAALPRIMW